MPITPFHLGPGLLLKAAAPGRVSFAAVVAATVVIDAEVIVRVLWFDTPYHAHLHTVLGATLAGLAAGGAVWAASRRWPWAPVDLRAALVGGILGGWLQPALDIWMHPDVLPFAPFSDAHFWGRVDFHVLHLACIAAGAAGAVWMAVREWHSEREGGVPSRDSGRDGNGAGL